MMMVQDEVHTQFLPFKLHDEIALRFMRQTAACAVLHGRRKLPRKSGQKFFLGQAGLLFQRRQDIRPDRLLQLRRRNLLVGTIIDAGLGYLYAVAAC